MAEQIKLRLVTPRRLLLDEDVEEVTAPGALGEFGVLPNHISFLSLLEIGELTYKQGSDRYYLALSGGYAEVLDNRMTVLANAAEYAREIDLDRAGRAKEKAERQLETLSRENKEFLAVEAALHRALVRMQVASRASRR
ncbi:MAG: F0F1 ATP synthase subunit epsilon [Candidatus Binatia bacterium]